MNYGTQNFTNSKLQKMQDKPCINAIRIGRTLPYHLQYVKEGKPNVKPRTDATDSEG